MKNIPEEDELLAIYYIVSYNYNLCVVDGIDLLNVTI